MAEESYIQFHYNFDNHERAMQSSLLVFYLLKEKVNFTSIPVNSEFLFPDILIKTSKDKVPSRYITFNFHEPQITENFKNQCRNIRESSLEEEVVSG